MDQIFLDTVGVGKSKVLTKSGKFGKLICRQIKTSRVLIQVFLPELKSNICIPIKIKAGTPVLSFSAERSFTCQLTGQKKVQVSRSQAKLHYSEGSGYLCLHLNPEESPLYILNLIFLKGCEINKSVAECSLLLENSPAFVSTIDFQRQVEVILREMEKPDPGSERINCHADSLLLEAIDQSLRLPEPEPAPGNPEERIVSLLAESMIAEMDEPWSIKKLAGSRQLKMTKVKKLFRKHTGSGASVFRISVRMQKAKQLLKETALSIQEISLQVGYNNPAQFATMFKRKTGCSPSDFRSASIGVSPKCL